MEYIVRLNTPSDDNKNYIHYTYGGYNYCIRIEGDSVLPNCVGYAWGRWRELLNEKPKLSRGNAEDWYNYNDGYERGSAPKLGAVACYKKGEIRDGSDGYGHVAIVEEIKDDGTIILSNSAYGSTKFYLIETKYPYKIYNTYDFQGFIYPPVEFKEKEEKTVDELANEVINGLWGNNPERREKLTEAGYDYELVQKRVNEILEEDSKLKVGDKVKIVATGNGSSYGKSNTAYGIGWKRTILKIYEDSEYPYQVGNDSGVTGYYKENALQKI